MLLKEFFNENHYHFTHSFAFDPVLNDGLKALEQMPAQVDKKTDSCLWTSRYGA